MNSESCTKNRAKKRTKERGRELLEPRQRTASHLKKK